MSAICLACYPHTGDFKSQYVTPQGFKRPAWRILDRLSGDLYVLSQTQNSIVRYAPLFIHSFVLCAPRKILEATQFNQRYRRYEEIDNVPDRFRWCRHSLKAEHRKSRERTCHKVCSLLLFFVVAMTASKSASFWLVGHFRDFSRWFTDAA